MDAESTRGPVWRGIATMARLAMAVATTTALGRDPSDATAVPGHSAREGIRQVVAALGYGPEVGDQFASFADGLPVGRWQAALGAAADRGDQKSVTEAESKVIDDIQRRLDATIQQADGRSGYWNLPDVLSDRQAQCLGNCQLWYVVGNAVGLEVAAIEVSQPPDGQLGEHETHVATLVRLADGRVRMIDARYDIDDHAFRLGEFYRREGAVWARADLAGRRRLHRRVRLLDTAGVKAVILLNTGNSYRRAGLETEAAPIYAHGLGLDPDSPSLHLAVGETSFAAGQWNDAERSIRTAIGLEPQGSEAYAALGRLQSHQSKWAEAVSAFDRAIALKPHSPDAVRSRQEAVRRRDETAEPARTAEHLTP